jgi:hypothetical protein
MLHRCLSCYATFPLNTTLERLSASRRIAFDPVRGRLWSVCDACARWTLQPIEERWEALAELDRIVTDRARLLAKTDNIALFSSADLEIVRVGDAPGREEAWWRYGNEFAARRQRARKVVRMGKIVDGAVMFLLTGVPIWAFSSADRWIDRARRREFGKIAWRGLAACEQCGASLRQVSFSDVSGMQLELASNDSPALRLTCKRCGQRHGGFALTGTAADHVLRRTLAYQNFAGANESEVSTAMRTVERLPSAAELLGATPQRRLLLSGSSTLALEIVLNRDLESRLMQMRVAELEARWREEERLAAIIDGELTR